MPGSGSRITECGILAFWQSSCLTFGRDDNDASGNFAPELQALLLKMMPSEMDDAPSHRHLGANDNNLNCTNLYM